MNRRTVTFIIILLLLASCAPSAHEVSSCVTSKPSGFWLGLWHGTIAPITFIISLFKDSVAVYELNNTGGWYDFGFIIGIGGLSTGASKSTRKN